MNPTEGRRRLSEIEFLRLRLARADVENSQLRLRLAEAELGALATALGLSTGDRVSEDGFVTRLAQP